MDVFRFREQLIREYESFARSFTKPKAEDIRAYLQDCYDAGVFWPAPLVQLNPSFVSGGSVEQLVEEQLLHKECARIFRAGKTADDFGVTLRLHKHQEEAIRAAQRNESYVLTTGTGSGKSLSYFIPIVDYVLRERAAGNTKPHVSAIVIYPMNALANSQHEELTRFLKLGYPDGKGPVTFARYTGQESGKERDEIAKNPPDIILTNFMMLELMMTRQDEVDKAIVRAAQGLKFLVLDELHTYRGRQGADVALLVRRVRAALNPDLLCVGTSATMATDGTPEERNAVVAGVASKLFGTSVSPRNVITETLQRVTTGDEPDAGTLKSVLIDEIPANAEYESLRAHPLAIWVELNLGLQHEAGKWVRARPRTLKDAAKELAAATGLDEAFCLKRLEHFLLLAYRTKREPHDDRSRLFAFRLHQFISGAGDLYATLEPAGKRYLDVKGQQFQPGHTDKRLFNAVFCRECGQEYFPVWASGPKGAPDTFEPREIGDRSREDQNDDEGMRYGFLMPDSDRTFDDADLDRYPEEWIDFSRADPRLKNNYIRYKPIPVRVTPSGEVAGDGMQSYFIPGSFRFCLSCGVSYDASVRSDLSKLTSLSSEGRSSATTVLTLGAMRYLLEDAADLKPEAKKLLGFTDNRQDASLQAGHFNDFIQILLLRGALLAAVEKAGQLTDEVLAQAVYDVLSLTKPEFMANPEARFFAEDQARKALKDVLGYRLYFDLRRGWRVTNPNLEQLSLLKIAYQSLPEICAEQSLWHGAPPLLAQASPQERESIARHLLDHMRRQLCIKARYLDADEQEKLKNASFSHLRDPWALNEDERLQPARYLILGSKPAHPNQQDDRAAYLSYRSSFKRDLSKPSFWGDTAQSRWPDKFDEEFFGQLMESLLSALIQGGLVQCFEVPGGRTAYQINAAALIWQLGDPDEEIPSLGNQRKSNNEFFRSLYLNVAKALLQNNRLLKSLEAREHTAQVDAADREEREKRFRSAELPILFCSPTMELGVDISDLNTVYMRNAPPTPANYAQRSGRAGRGGQPALVITYCAAKSPHDQYYFADPVRMVAGSVTPPLLDLANEDLIRSHLHAVWLAETHQKLSGAVSELLKMKEDSKLPLRDDLASALDTADARDRAYKMFARVLDMLADELTPAKAHWYTAGWAERMIKQAYLQFDQALDRWRTLYKATTQQMEAAHAVRMNAAATQTDRIEADRRYYEAKTQQDLLLESSQSMNSDFYTYRYLASQGFLPGYNFPRLPLLAFMPARKDMVGKDTYLSRPRFLALSEFGPRSIIYHEGSQYRVYKLMLGLREQIGADAAGAGLPLRMVRMCPSCGYGHFGGQLHAEKCIACGSLLEGGLTLANLYRVENVSTRRATRITSDEEERVRQGYEMLTTLQYAEENGVLQVIKTRFEVEGVPLATVHYGPAATVWRMNLGWKRRKDKSIYGFNIDPITGIWAKDAQAPEDSDSSDHGSDGQPKRIVPFVEDRRNILVFYPDQQLEEAAMVTLQYMLKRGIEAEFQLEEAELAAEPLPSGDKRNAILFYESAEGGAGVLTRIANDPTALRRVAEQALKVAHFEPKSGVWAVDQLQDTDKTCEAGCYRCLLSYSNQMDHRFIQRKNEIVLDLLCRMTRAEAKRGTAGRNADEQFEELMRLSGSGLEKAWLETVRKSGYRLPDKAQFSMNEFKVRPDFGYGGDSPALVFIDGPHHELDYQRQIDEAKNKQLRDAGFEVIRFPKEQSAWPAIFAQYPDVFGKGVQS
ncbi:MAG: DEAD/DEAH box helicase [Rhodocyclaceae bacterium]|nr:DEAD/DEAH box helicase [Rhodocyclaceae bacterium]